MKIGKLFTISLILALMLSMLPAQLAGAATTELFFSEYIEGSSFNKAVEIYNGTGSTVDLSTYTVELYSNGAASPSQSVSLSGTLADGDVFVMAHGSADAAILAETDLVSSSVINFNGDDALVLRNGSAVVDSFGQVGIDPGSEWTGGGQDDTLRRAETVCAGDTDPSDAFDASVEWVTFAQNTFDGLGSHATNCDGGGSTATDVFMSEYIEGSSFNKAIEIYNGTDSAIDLGTGNYTLELYSNGSSTVSQSMALSGTIASGDVYVLAHPSANTAILTEADVTNGSVINFNGDDAVVLRKDGAVIDAFGQIGFDPGSQWDGGGQDDTLRRAEAICTGDTNPDDAFDASLEWVTFAQDTFDGLGSHTANCGGGGGPSAPVINEFSASTTGSPDVEYVEVFGDPNTDYSAFTVIEIEGDSATGNIDRAFPVGSTDGSGFWTTNVGNLSIENGTITLLLVDGFTGSVGDDIDADDDGVIDFAPWSSTVDDVAVTDGDTGDLTYSSVVLGPNYDGLSSFAPGGASRIPDGFDTDTASDWVRNDFDLFGISGFAGSPMLGEAVNTPNAANATISVPTDPIGMCGDPSTLIHDIQGSGLASSDVGSIREVEAVVVATFYGPNQIGGYFLQEEDTDADADPLTSEGLRVFDTTNTPSVGDLVRIRGSVTEFFDLTELNNVTNFAACGTGVVTAAEVSLPFSSIDALEAYEGMLVTFPQTLYIAEYFNFDRFGEIVLSTERQFQPTSVYDPGSPEAAQLLDENLRSRIKLDDGRGNQNPDPALHPNGSVFDLDNLFRGGETLDNVTGVLDYNFGEYKVQLTQGATYTNANPRTAAPEDVGGNLKVASFNVLNYFTTLDYPTGDPLDNMCGPLQNQECRGADNAEEFTRQRDKIIAAIAAIDADVVGLIEIENHPGDVPTADLVSGLNDLMGAGTYDYVATGALGIDAIRQAFIYKPATVSLVGDYAVLDDQAFTNPLGYVDEDGNLEEKSRPALAQTFTDNETGGVFTVVVNHLKSKGSSCGPGDDDPEAGSCNLTRALGTQVLVDWLANDPTGIGDGDFLIIGDLNSYDKEDPIDVLIAEGYADLVYQYQGEDAYSYVFDGQLGYLDHALGNADMSSEVTNVTIWHINADEPDIIDYDTSFKRPAQAALYEDNAYRSSDHDPVIVGLELTTEQQINELIAMVQALVDDGTLNGGQGNALISKLENVLDKLAHGNTNAAANQLGAFINQVEDFIYEGVLTAEQGDPLIKVATALVEALSN